MVFTSCTELLLDSGLDIDNGQCTVLSLDSGIDIDNGQRSEGNDDISQSGNEIGTLYEVFWQSTTLP